jgi:hypothetical protein
MVYSYLNLFLFVIILLSKEVIVFNEEILVLFAFGLFVYLVSAYGGVMLAEELDTRGLKIKEELDLFKGLQQKTLQYLINYHSKQRQLTSELQNILRVSKEELVTFELYHTEALINTTLTSLDERLKRIVIVETSRTAAKKTGMFVFLETKRKSIKTIFNNFKV